MNDKYEKPLSSKKAKDTPTPNFQNYFTFIFIFIIIIEVFLIINSSQKYKQQKELFKSNQNIILSKNNNISQLLIQISKNEQEIKENEIKINNNKNMLQSIEQEKTYLINKRDNLSEKFHESFKEYESMIDIIDYEISEKNDTLKELYSNLTDKVLIRNSLEEKLDSLEENMIIEVPKIRMKSSILDNDENKILLLTKWLSGIDMGEVKKIKLIYSAEDHDFDSFSFHEICGNEDIRNTLIIIKTEKDDIIGGFTLASWRANSLISYDDKAFVFNLNKEMKIRVSSPSNAIHSRINDGPIFGMYDLIVNLNKIKVQEKMESYGDKDLGIGNDAVNIVNYEVFTVIFN
jgi:hypothetical protein